ncbi:MAG: rhomboid family intramembrane serine protease [Clostridia bacterium]|nr:rhomboid family intramembrane serine protease [Clostridia bacterium]
MSASGRRFRISFNAPAVLGFVGICVAVQVLSVLTGGASNRALFSVYRSSFADPLAYLRCIFHVFGHGDWSHLMSNMMYVLILGPMLEEKYGTSNMIFVMLVTALVTGVLNLILFPGTRLLGASGIVFAMILLSSITTEKEGAIPLSFILVAALYIGQQIYEGIFLQDNVSQLTHIAGGVVGSVLGFMMNRMQRNANQR